MIYFEPQGILIFCEWTLVNYNNNNNNNNESNGHFCLSFAVVFIYACVFQPPPFAQPAAHFCLAALRQQQTKQNKKNGKKKAKGKRRFFLFVFSHYLFCSFCSLRFWTQE